MKKFACHRIYTTPYEYQGQSVIVVGEKGEVVLLSKLENETHFTEWIGGVVVLSHKKDLSLEKDFSYFLQIACSVEENFPVYAWHISPFDFEKEDFTPQSLLRKLH